MADAVAAILDDHDSPCLESRPAGTQDGIEPGNEMGRACVAQAEKNNADRTTTTERDYFSEVQIEGKQDPLFASGLSEDLGVGEAL